MRRHCWIVRWREGRQVSQCDRCELVRPYQPERNLPAEGCRGSLFEQQQASERAYVPDAAYLETALSRGRTVQQIADAWALTPGAVQAAVDRLGS